MLLESTVGREVMDSFEVIGAGECVSAKKPAPNICYWVLTRPHLEALARRQ